MKRLAPALLFFLLSLLMNLPWLGMTPLSGTEGHRALTADEMVQSHQWLVPILYGRPYLAKPPLHHWLIATSETIAGHPSLFVWRLPSALDGAILCAAAWWFAGRWFGNTAGLVSGGVALGMIALWGEHQVADIDATDTLAATLAAFFAIEALFGRPRYRRAWIVAAGLAVGATCMTKGPAGLPIIAAVALYSVISAIWLWFPLPVRRERARVRVFPAASQNALTPTLSRRTGRGSRIFWELIRPAAWAPLLIGIAIFAGYAGAVLLRLKHLGLGLDLSGLHEAAKDLHPGTLHQILLSLALAPTVFFYTLPASLALPLSFWSAIRRAMGDGRQRRIAGALAGALLISWAICLLSGMINPRYAYPTVAVLCPLAGIVAVAGVRAGGNATHWIRGTAIGSAIALGGAGAWLAFSAWKYSRHISATFTFPLSLCALVSILAAAWVVLNMAHSWRAAWGLVALAVIVSVPFAFQCSFARTASSGKQLAGKVREMVGNQMLAHPIAQGNSLTYKPEIFFYAHTPTRAYLPDDFNPRKIPPGTWIYLNDVEYADWRWKLGSRLQHARIIAHGGLRTYWLAWYAPTEP